MLHLVNCTVFKSKYMGDKKHETVNHIAEAQDDIEAALKVKNFYKNKSVDYDVFYQVEINYINEVL